MSCKSVMFTTIMNYIFDSDLKADQSESRIDIILIADPPTATWHVAVGHE